MSTRRDLKIAYLCDISPLETWSYSGGNARIHAALQEHVGEVTILDPSWGRFEPLRRLLEKLPLAITLRARWRLQLLLSKYLAGTIAAQLRQRPYDVLFCPYSFHALAGLRLPYPLLVVFTSDATPSTYKNSEIGAAYGSFWSFSRYLDPWILRHEKRVFRAVDVNLWPSEWQKQSADQLFSLDPSRSALVPWGANIAPPKAETTPLNLGPDIRIRLLLVGRDWQAKGGPRVVEVLKELHSRGVEAHLSVVGCHPPAAEIAAIKPADISIHPELNQRDTVQAALLKRLFSESHFLVMPSFESYGFAFCEAAAFGLPALGLKIGGVPIKEGQSGHALDPSAGAADFADVICRYRSDDQAYAALRLGARRYYEQALNWQAWGAHTKELITQRLATDQKRED